MVGIHVAEIEGAPLLNCSKTTDIANLIVCALEVGLNCVICAV